MVQYAIVLLELLTLSASTIQVDADVRQGPPTFAQYSVPSATRAPGKVIGVDRWTEQETDSRFARRIRRAARGKANFAGHYAIVGWSCGMICVNLVIVDTRSGVIHDTPFVGIGDGPCPASYRQQEPRLIEFRSDSRLLVLRGVGEDPTPDGKSFSDAPCSARYYVWRRGHLVLIREDRYQ